MNRPTQPGRDRSGSGLETAHAGTGDGEELVELELVDCLALVGERGVGRLGFNDDDGPLVLPANYVFHGGVVHIRTGEGAKLDAAEARSRAAFEVDDVDEHGGWSVVIRGYLRRLVVSEGPGNLVEPVPAAAGDREQLIALVPKRITGRRVGPLREHPRTVADDLGNIWWGRDGSDLLG